VQRVQQEHAGAEEGDPEEVPGKVEADIQEVSG